MTMMPMRTKKFQVGQRVEVDGQPCVVVSDNMRQPSGTINVRNRFGYVETVKLKTVKEAKE